MTHFIAYNKVEDWGAYPVGRTEFRHYSGHPKSKLEQSIGQTLWVISGERIKGKMVYKLCSVYQPSRLQKLKTGGFLVSGKGTGFKPHIELNGRSWLEELLKEQGNFQYGLNQIKSARVIKSLKQLRKEQNNYFPLPDEVPPNEKLSEGSKKRVTVNAYERNAKARAACIARYGNTCIVCGFDFQKQYGRIGEGYIHVHHLRPLAEIGAKYEVDPEKDLKPVCPNCHAMLHAKEPPFRVEALRKLVTAKFAD